MGYKDFDRIDRKRKSHKIVFNMIIWLIIIASAMLLGFITINFTIEKTIMTGRSMGETLTDGDEIIINKLSFMFVKPKRFDVIVFKQDGKEHNYYNIKRIIGLPGETVQIIDGSVYIDNVMIEEPIDVEPIHIPGLAEEEIILLEDEYFVLGDARNESEDSRFANIGNVVSTDIIGKAYIRIKPTITIISQSNLRKPIKNEETNNNETNNNETNNN